MSFYVITYGETGINNIFSGQTKDDAINSARPLINKWPEYQAMCNEELIELLDDDLVEFDMVEIPMEYPSDNCNPEYLKAAYMHYYSGQQPPHPKPEYSEFH